ncbi:MAG TPA: DnaA N-terminal domain-containing protein [Bryobacteraceae bacterium]|nr:DnaA N-terminal domain-containing protein [Bryobacteraceae bacterium]
MITQNNAAARVPEWLATLGIKEGEYFSDSKIRFKRAMKSRSLSEAGRIWCCLALHTAAFQQELAVKMVAGKRVPLTPGDIASETGIRKQNIRRGLSQLEAWGLAEVHGTAKARIEIYARMKPENLDSEKIKKAEMVIARDYHFEVSEEAAADIMRLFRAFKIQAATNFVITRDYLLEVTAAERDYQRARMVLRSVLNRARARDPIQINERKLENNLVQTSSSLISPVLGTPDSTTTKTETTPKPELMSDSAKTIAEGCGMDEEAAAAVYAGVLEIEPSVTPQETIELVRLKKAEMRGAMQRGKIDNLTGFLIHYVPKMAKGPQMALARKLANQKANEYKSRTPPGEEIPDPSDPWSQIRIHLRQRVSPEGYANWLRNTSFAGVADETLLVRVPDKETRQWLETEYAKLIESAICELRLPVGRIAFQTDSTVGTPKS